MINKSTRKLISLKQMTSKQRCRLLREIRRTEAELYTLANALSDDVEREKDWLEQQVRSKHEDARLLCLDTAHDKLGDYIEAVDTLNLPDQVEVL